MTYAQIEAELRSNHFYPDKVVKNGKTVALQVSCAPILMASKVKRLHEILGEENLILDCLTNEGFILIRKKK